MFLESVFPTSSTKVAANQRAAIVLSTVKERTSSAVDGPSSADSTGTNCPRARHKMRCRTHPSHDDENCKKYTTSVEVSFRTTSDPVDSSKHLFSQVTSV